MSAKARMRPRYERNFRPLSQLGRFNQRQRLSQRPFDGDTGYPVKRTVLHAINVAAKRRAEKEKRTFVPYHPTKKGPGRLNF